MSTRPDGSSHKHPSTWIFFSLVRGSDFLFFFLKLARENKVVCNSMVLTTRIFILILPIQGSGTGRVDKKMSKKGF